MTRNGKVAHQQYYFVLSENVLTWFGKKNDTQSIDEIVLPCRILELTDYVKGHAFEVIPLQLSENNQFIENREDSVTLVARSDKDYNDWYSLLTGISKKIMEVYVFGDTLPDDTNDEIFDKSQQYNQIQKSMMRQSMSWCNLFHFCMQYIV